MSSSSTLLKLANALDKTAGVAILTKHEKLALVAPALRDLGLELQLATGFDTDTLGTFSGEITREQTPLACVKTKAKLAAELSGLRYGIGSEGSFGGGPMPGLVNWDDELLAFYDSNTEQFIVANASGPVPLSSLLTDDLKQIQAHIANAESGQRWVCQVDELLTKGLASFADIEHWFVENQLLVAGDKIKTRVTLSPDLRAHYCPARQVYIRKAAEQLAERLQSLCPACQSPNFWRTGAQTGLPCAECGLPTPRVKQYRKSCECCGHTELEAATETVAEPSHCPRCNP